MAANGIPVRLFEAMRPTPELSFAVREYGCVATQRHRQPQSPGVQWLPGLLVRRRPAAPPARGGHRRPDGGPGCL
ncbi:MAG: hypothetical protein ACLR53_00070 [Evtepia gabavorous]